MALKPTYMCFCCSNFTAMVVLAAIQLLLIGAFIGHVRTWPSNFETDEQLETGGATRIWKVTRFFTLGLLIVSTLCLAIGSCCFKNSLLSMHQLTSGVQVIMASVALIAALLKMVGRVKDDHEILFAAVGYSVVVAVEIWGLLIVYGAQRELLVQQHYVERYDMNNVSGGAEFGMLPTPMASTVNVPRYGNSNSNTNKRVPRSLRGPDFIVV